MTNEELEKKFSPFVKVWDCFHDVPLEENNASECAKIAIDFAIRQLHIAKSGQQASVWNEILEQINELQKQKSEL